MIDLTFIKYLYDPLIIYLIIVQHVEGYSFDRLKALLVFQTTSGAQWAVCVYRRDLKIDLLSACIKPI